MPLGPVSSPRFPIGSPPGWGRSFLPGPDHLPVLA